MKITFSFGTIFILLVILKVIGIINLSWWIIFIPIWLPFSIWILLVIGVYLISQKNNYDF